MSFKYSCIGDNSPENREHLEKIGMEMSFLVSFVDFELIYTWKGGFYFIDKSDLKGLEMSLFTNCIGNPALFQAVTAMREDSDSMQCFICEVGNSNFWHFCERPSMDEDSRFFGFTAFRKATLEELINHFNSK